MIRIKTNGLILKIFLILEIQNNLQIALIFFRKPKINNNNNNNNSIILLNNNNNNNKIVFIIKNIVLI